jgi:hypothetical protein
VLNKNAIRGPRHDAIAAYIIHEVVSNHNVEAGVPTCAPGVVAVRSDPGTIDGADEIALDREAIETARGLVPNRAKDNAAVIFSVIPVSIHAIDVVDVEPGNYDVFRGTEIVEEDVNSATNRTLRTVVRDLEVPYLDVLDVVETEYVFDLAVAFELRFWPDAVTINAGRRTVVA